MFPQLNYDQMAGWGSIYKPHGESSRWGQTPVKLLLTGRVRSSRPLSWQYTDRTLASVRSPTTGHDWSQICRSGTLLYLIGRCCPASGRLPPASGPVSGRLTAESSAQRPVACPASGYHSELISSRSFIRLGSNLHAWTLLDLLGLLLCS